MRITNEKLLAELRLRPCFICGLGPTEIHHLKTVKTFGPDTDWNCLPLCRHCHSLFHNRGIYFMAEKFIHFKEWLIKNGWTIDETSKKWRHYE